MCLIVFAWRAHAEYPFVLAANRDEFHARSAEPLHWWPDLPGVAAGRDLEAGGTWLAAARRGRFATVTNYRETLEKQAGERSRGSLVSDFVTGDLSPLAHLQAVDGWRFAGFSLLAATPSAIAYVSNRGDPARTVAPGVHGLSNASLDTPWPKVVRSKARLQALLAEDAVGVPALFGLLADRQPADATAGPASDLPPETARAVGAAFVVTAAFGTRCSTVLLLDRRGRVSLHERRFDAAGDPVGETTIEFAVEG